MDALHASPYRFLSAGPPVKAKMALAICLSPTRPSCDIRQQRHRDMGHRSPWPWLPGLSASAELELPSLQPWFAHCSAMVLALAQHPMSILPTWKAQKKGELRKLSTVEYTICQRPCTHHRAWAQRVLWCSSQAPCSRPPTSSPSFA